MQAELGARGSCPFDRRKDEAQGTFMELRDAAQAPLWSLRDAAQAP